MLRDYREIHYTHRKCETLQIKVIGETEGDRNRLMEKQLQPFRMGQSQKLGEKGVTPCFMELEENVQCSIIQIRGKKNS